MHESQSTSQTACRARKLVQAAAFAAALVPLGSVAADAGTIECNHLDACVGNYPPDSGGTNTWQFYDDIASPTRQLFYEITIGGDLKVGASFGLRVGDVVEPQGSLPLGGAAAAAFPNAQCVPTLNENHCGLFDVTLSSANPLGFLGDFFMSMTWFSNANPLSAPASDPPGGTRILRADGYTTFTDGLSSTSYVSDESVLPNVLTLRGESSTIGRFGAFTDVVASPVPEPGSAALVAAGVLVLFLLMRRT